MPAKQEKGYRNTLNLPRTAFSMKANLAQKEPQQRKVWAKSDIYNRIRRARSGCEKYILHDGPPYANGDIHMGHVINKVLKDFVVKYKTMKGFDAPYVPGWDCHGLPIEVKVTAELGDSARRMPKLQLRYKCKKYAAKYIKLQSRQFQELGVFGDFENPYLTFKPQYEAAALEVFAELVNKGLVHKQLKPIHWSVGCETALAEAELEYKQIKSPSIFVNFPVAEQDIGRLIESGVVENSNDRICLMVWTTTPWTLAANLAVAVNPKLEYAALSYQKDGRNFVSLVADERSEAVIAKGQLQPGSYNISEKKIKGSQLAGLRYLHPFVRQNPTDKDAYMVINADFVTTEDGTGLVHIAPGHGVEDYIAGQKHGLAIYSPVGNDGCYDNTVPQWLRGKKVLKADSAVSQRLNEDGLLFAETEIMHSYPYCWRSKEPVIFRATEQWFISIDKEIPAAGKTLRDMSLQAVKDVKWVPSWSRKRIEGMLESRPDWCISRQRSWGLPIPVFINSQGKNLLTKDSVLAVAKHIAEKGSDSWFTDSPRQILGEDFKLPADFDFDDLQKEENIFDVWFESGCSWYAVAEKSGWPVPVDLYLEGSDQHRGWFQLSLLLAMGFWGREPFKTVLTHGFTVDEKGIKQSKSLGNYVNAQAEAAKYGSDILRLWVASVNYQEDMRCNDELIGRTQDSYRKIRNTLRYLFGNTDDFDPNKNSVPYEDMPEIDKWAILQLQKLIADVTEYYDSFAFHKVFSSVYNFCTVQMSSIYMDVLKDRLYCEQADSRLRRSSQTVMHRILDALVRIIAPILVHTAEEAWSEMKFKSPDAGSVHLADMPAADESIDLQNDADKWTRMMSLRDDVFGALEQLRQDKKITSNQQADITIYSNDEQLAGILNDFGTDNFADLCIVSRVKLEKGQLKIEAQKSSYRKCQRCWNYRQDVGSNSQYPDLCSRCISVVRSRQDNCSGE